MKKFLTVLLCLVLVFNFVACTKPEEKNNGKITLVLDWTPNTNHTGIFVAKDKGYFEEAGLDVEIVQPPEDGADTLVASGKAQFGITFQDTIAPAWAKDSPLPVTAVAAVVNHNTSGIISLKDKGIDSFKNMEDKVYATWENPIELAIIKNLVEKQGADFSKVKLVPSTVTDVIAALQTDVDAVWVYYGWDGVAANLKELQVNFLNFAEENYVFDYYSPIMIGNNEYLEKNPDQAKAFVEAISKGYTFAAQNPQEASKILLKESPELKEDLVDASQAWISDEYIRDGEKWGEIDPQRWNGFYAWLWENKLIEKEIPENFGFTNEFLPK